MDGSLVSFFEGHTDLYLISKYNEDKRSLFEREWRKKSYDQPHVFVLSSGTTSKKSIDSFALSRDALFENAKAVNKRFHITKNDRWLASLSSFHIGGLSILARAYLSESEVISFSQTWNPISFVNELTDKNIQYASLVPTQLYDIVSQGVKSPKNFKAIFVGGDFASTSLCKRAVDLGWRIIITFGMTEVCSQMASSYFEDIEDGYIEMFDIHHLTKQDDHYRISSKSLFSEKIQFLDNSIKLISPLEFKLNDYIDVKEQGVKTFIKPLGRRDDVFKIKGRLYHLNTLRDDLADAFIQNGIFNKIQIQIKKEERDGSKIMIYLLNELKPREKEIREVIAINSGISINSFSFVFVEYFEKTLIGKLKKR